VPPRPVIIESRRKETWQKSHTNQQNSHRRRFLRSSGRHWTRKPRRIDAHNIVIVTTKCAKYFELARLRIQWKHDPEMLAASICLEVYYTLLPSTTMTSRVPRCLFGKPNPQETIEMLQDALDAERSRFARRWGVNPCSEDKENNYRRWNNEKSQPSPNKKRSNPYSRQTSIHGEQHFSREISPRILFSN